MPNPLRDYQMDAVVAGFNVASEFGGFYIQHDPGMGKTLTLITLARLLKVRRIVVVCPPVAFGVWRREVAKWWKTSPVEGAEWRLISYDSLVDPIPAAKGVKRRNTGRTRLHDLQDWQPELLVLDEAQYVKGNNAKRTMAVMKLRGASTTCVALSGTPQHNILDLWSQYRMVAKDEPLFQQAFSKFRAEMVVMGGPSMNWPMKDKKTGTLKFKPGAEDRLAEATAMYTHVAKSSQMHITEPVETVVPVELDQREMKAYYDMEDLLRADLPDGSEAQAEIVLTKLLRLTQIASGSVTNVQKQAVDLGSSKLDACMELIDLRPEQKIVVACRFRRDIERIRDKLNARGRPCSLIWGDTTPPFRTKYEDWFQQGNHNGVMILQYQAGGVAITLHAAQTLILYTLDPSVIRYKQMIGRVWRMGLDHISELLTLCAEGTQDEVMLQALRSGLEHTDMARLLLKYLRRS